MSSDKLKRITVVVVGFKVNAERSIAYMKFDTPSDRELGCYLNVLFHTKDTDFVSIRRIPREQP